MSLINLDLLFNAITGIANPLIKEKVQRSETVIKLLKQFDIDPEHPPADFSGVYAYALVEYGVGKPKPVLELFRQEEIKKAFRQAFDRNNASILLSEVDDFIDAYALGDEIKNLRIDIRREIAAFYIIFSEVAKRTRNPADTMMSQQIGSLHRRIANIQEQLNRLPTLEGIRTEIARLALPENVETRHVASLQNENQCRAIALAQQMRGWFETLGYNFEKHEVWTEEYFELIINIPVRRSFDRILVRGIAGEVGLSLEALPDIEAGKPVDMSRVYLYAVRRKMERDIKAERTFTSLADKLYFLCELSWEMLSSDQMSLNYKLFPDRIRRLFGSIVQEQNDLDHWHYDMMGQTMLIRNANGDYTPAHRSLLEFFVAYKFAAELGALADDFTELARSQSCLDGSAEAIEYTWSSYFSRQLDETGRSIAIAALKGFTSEPLEKLKETFGRSPLAKAVIDLMLGMVSNNKEALIKAIKSTQRKSEDEVGYIGGNAANLAINVNYRALEEQDFSGAVIKGADFSNASLRSVTRRSLIFDSKI